MKSPMFTRPRTEAFDVHAFGDGYRAVLVPTKSPIGIGSLVEKDGSYWAAYFAQDGGSQGADGPVAVEKRAQRCDTE